ncbi:hypothetical protein GCM10027406_33750 [Leifsonia lichenia]
MTSTSPEYGAPNGQPWQPGPPVPPQQQQPYQQPYTHPSAAAAPAPGGYVLHRWPRWAQNTAVIVGAVAVLVVVFFAGFFTANAVDHGRVGIGTGQNFQPRQFGGNGNGFGQNGGQNGGQTQNGGTGGQTQNNG